jgi:hypothetical protein
VVESGLGVTAITIMHDYMVIGNRIFDLGRDRNDQKVVPTIACRIVADDQRGALFDSAIAITDIGLDNLT